MNFSLDFAAPIGRWRHGMNRPQRHADPPLGDETDAFVTLIVQHRHLLYAFIAKQLVNPADTEDVFQKTSLVLWKKMDTIRSARQFLSLGLWSRFQRSAQPSTKSGRNRLHFDSDLSELLAEESMAEEELTQARLKALDACMEKLSPRQQQILRRCYDGTSTISEVAGTLGRSRDALYKQLARLRENCRIASVDISRRRIYRSERWRTQSPHWPTRRRRDNARQHQELQSL